MPLRAPASEGREGGLGSCEASPAVDWDPRQLGRLVAHIESHSAPVSFFKMKLQLSLRRRDGVETPSLEILRHCMYSVYLGGESLQYFPRILSLVFSTSPSRLSPGYSPPAGLTHLPVTWLSCLTAAALPLPAPRPPPPRPLRPWLGPGRLLPLAKGAVQESPSFGAGAAADAFAAAVVACGAASAGLLRFAGRLQHVNGAPLSLLRRLLGPEELG